MPANYVLLERIELNASAASVTFANIPQTGYTDLKIVGSTRSSNSNNYGDVFFTFNGLTTNRSARYIEGSGSAVSSATQTTMGAGSGQGNSATANTFGSWELYIPNYTSSNFKSSSADGVGENNATQAYASLYANLWSSTAAITSVTVLPLSTFSFVQYSTFSLYGLAALGTTPVIAPKASGGNVIATDGTYWYHAFRTSGTFTPAQGLSCEVMVAAGGGGGGSGGGGSNDGAGGGAGGFRVLTSQSLISQGYTVTVGGGGTSGSGARGGVGTNSSFAGSGFTTITSSGGGGGATTLNSAGLAGGSGGGAAGTGGGTGTVGTGNAGSYSPVEGFAGGLGASDGATYDNAGGGGGATAVGVAANSVGGGAGGAGSSAYSSWASATATGVSSAYAGGGGGAGFSAKTAGAGGTGGGGAGSNGNGNNATAGTVNSAGGGGGGGINGIGGLGGSGIVIIRYTIA